MLDRNYVTLSSEQKELAKMMLADHKKKLVDASFFTCAACYTKKWAGTRGDEAIVNLFLAKKKLGQGRNVATYVICKECVNLPEKEIYERVDHYMAAQGLYNYTG